MTTPKERYFKKVYDNAIEVACACGCGTLIKNKDKYGRNKSFVSGHNRRKYANPTQYKREWNHRNRVKRYEYKRLMARSRKISLIKKKNGKCFDCGVLFNGFNDCIFDFHHDNPTTKSFALNQNGLVNHSLGDIENELDKVTLLCANCHRLRHNNYN